jgi:hypothetical protein
VLPGFLFQLAVELRDVLDVMQMEAAIDRDAHPERGSPDGT